MARVARGVEGAPLEHELYDGLPEDPESHRHRQQHEAEHAQAPGEGLAQVVGLPAGGLGRQRRVEHGGDGRADDPVGQRVHLHRVVQAKIDPSARPEARKRSKKS